MDLNSIAITGVFIVLGGVVLVLLVSFLAYKIRNKQTYKNPAQNYSTQEYFQPIPAPVPIQYYQIPALQYSQYHTLKSANQQPAQTYRPRVSPYQVYIS